MYFVSRTMTMKLKVAPISERVPLAKENATAKPSVLLELVELPP